MAGPSKLAGTLWGTVPPRLETGVWWQAPPEKAWTIFMCGKSLLDALVVRRNILQLPANWLGVQWRNQQACWHLEGNSAPRLETGVCWHALPKMAHADFLLAMCAGCPCSRQSIGNATLFFPLPISGLDCLLLEKSVRWQRLAFLRAALTVQDKPSQC